MMKPLLPASFLMIFLCACGKQCTDEKKAPASNASVNAGSNHPITPAQPRIRQNPRGELKRSLTPKEKSQVVNQILQARARQQAAGLGHGSVSVNKAWNYQGYSYLSPNPSAAIEARLVAVDLTISGHTKYFDFDDIEIVDGETMVSYGSDPQAVPLSLSDGHPMPPGEIPAPAPKASRWLMIYAFPKNTSTFHLYYWGRKLTLHPTKIAPSGWELPYPEPEKE